MAWSVKGFTSAWAGQLISSHRRSITVWSVVKITMADTFGATATRSGIPNDQVLVNRVDLDRFPLYGHATPYHADVGKVRVRAGGRAIVNLTTCRSTASPLTTGFRPPSISWWRKGK